MRVPAARFKAKCLQIMDEVHDTKTEVTVTKHGKPVAKLVPSTGEGRDKRPVFGFLKGTVVIHGDLTRPVEEDWDVDS